MVSNLRVKFKDGTEKLFFDIMGIQMDEQFRMLELRQYRKHYFIYVNLDEIKYIEEIEDTDED